MFVAIWLIKMVTSAHLITALTALSLTFQISQGSASTYFR